MKTKIVATEFALATVEGMGEGSNIKIIHDPENKYDSKALAVYFTEERIGYIGKGTDLYDLNRDNFPMQGKVVDFYISQEDDKFTRHPTGTLVSCNIQVKDVVELDDKNNIASFNEEGVVINFDEKPHTYTFEGRILKGATTFIQRYIKPFDDFMVGRSSKSWGIEPKTIKNAWKLAGNLAATFGTAIHSSLEFEDLYRSFYKKSGDRCFTIKHPTIKRIVEEFFELNKRLGIEGEIIPEALVSDVENDICGLADRIIITDRANKICEIADYKVNHSFDKKGQVSFVNLPKQLELPTTKLSKLALQLNFHQRMLEKSGWTVTALHGFIYTDKWEYYLVTELSGFNILTGKMDK
ncbi:MAG: hypothetical protein QM499_00805 [Flavobacteriaceae bacterium]